MQVSFAMHGIVLLQSLGLGSYPRTSIVWHTRWQFNGKDYTNLGNEITPILWTKMRKQSFKLIFYYFKYKRFLLQNLNGKFPTFATGNYYWDELHKGEILKLCAASFESMLSSHSDKKLGDIRILSAPHNGFLFVQELFAFFRWRENSMMNSAAILQCYSRMERNDWEFMANCLYTTVATVEPHPEYESSFNSLRAQIHSPNILKSIRRII